MLCYEYTARCNRPKVLSQQFSITKISVNCGGAITPLSLLSVTAAPNYTHYPSAIMTSEEYPEFY